MTTEPDAAPLTEASLAAVRSLDPQSHDDIELIVKHWPRLLATLDALREALEDARATAREAQSGNARTIGELRDALAERTRERDALRGELPLTKMNLSIYNTVAEWMQAGYRLHAVGTVAAIVDRAEAVERERAALREALTRCRAQFQLYVEIHESKGADGIEKAARNRCFVALCDDALAPRPPCSADLEATQGKPAQEE